MLSLRQASRLRDDAGQRLPRVWDSFEAQKIVRRRGQLYLTAAAPGVGKSVFALNEVVKMQVPALYLSMDTDAFTTATRALQLLELVDQDGAEAAVKSEDRWAMEALSATPWVKFSFPSSPDTEEIAMHLFAYAECEGEFPHWVVIDNLMDVAFEEDENRGINRIMEDLAKLARLSKAGVHVLHHTVGEYEDGRSTIPLSGLRNKVSKKPAMVLTANNGSRDGQLWFSVVKNRFGPADPAGLKVRAELLADYAHVQMWDPVGGAA